MKAPERRANTPAGRRRIAGAATLWGILALSGTTILSALAIWHLVRRGRLLRESLGPPKPASALKMELPPSDPA